MDTSKVVVAMSGGVDSSVAAVIMAQKGLDVTGVTLQLWGKDVCVSAGSRLCCSVRDSIDAKAVCKLLGIRHQVLELADVFRESVIGYFVQNYREGLTPNPCIACNDHIKFGSLLDHAESLGASIVATGHYARKEYDSATERYKLLSASYDKKDQSYVLFNLNQDQLARAEFPLGELAKEEVREIARSLGLGTADKPESQDICFVRDRDKDGFLRRELNIGDEPGPIIDTKGNMLGEHQGLLGYTVGQREGIGVSAAHPFYVISMDKAHNRLIVGSRDELLETIALIERVNWLSIDPPTKPICAKVKIRARHPAGEAEIIPIESDKVRIEFKLPQSAITPGQAAVFYEGDLVLGGGWIVEGTKAELKIES